jgi:hypothetical protein
LQVLTCVLYKKDIVIADAFTCTGSVGQAYVSGIPASHIDTRNNVIVTHCADGTNTGGTTVHALLTEYVCVSVCVAGGWVRARRRVCARAKTAMFKINWHFIGKC